MKSTTHSSTLNVYLTSAPSQAAVSAISKAQVAPFMALVLLKGVGCAVEGLGAMRKATGNGSRH